MSNLQVTREQLARLLKQYRESNKLTVYQVGEIVGKSGKTISAWESGRGQPDADMLVRLCKVYNISSISELFGEKSENSIVLSIKEKEVISQYRNKPELQQAVNILLGVGN